MLEETTIISRETVHNILDNHYPKKGGGVCWLNQKKPRAQNVGIQKSQMKTVLTAFFDTKGIIQLEFSLENRL
jgi:hypothetical protein